MASSEAPAAKRELTILHFNDVYQIEVRRLAIPTRIPRPNRTGFDPRSTRESTWIRAGIEVSGARFAGVFRIGPCAWVGARGAGRQPRETEPVGGADRFISKVRSYAADEPLILFSGDVFSPSNRTVATERARQEGRARWK